MFFVYSHQNTLVRRSIGAGELHALVTQFFDFATGVQLKASGCFAIPVFFIPATERIVMPMDKVAFR